MQLIAEQQSGQKSELTEQFLSTNSKQSKTLCAPISKQVSAFASFKSHLAVFPNTVVRNWKKINMCFQDSLFTWHTKQNVTKMISLLRSASQRRELRGTCYEIMLRSEMKIAYMV